MKSKHIYDKKQLPCRKCKQIQSKPIDVIEFECSDCTRKSLHAPTLDNKK